MKFKNNITDSLTQVEAMLQRIQLQVNRNVSREEIEETIDKTKTQIENIKSMVSMESDDFMQ
jgi:ferritin-like metal-binding protein YciE